MKIWDYLQITLSQFFAKYVETGLVDVATHDTFPLQMLTYGREAVHTNIWDEVTRKCRGIIFNTETDEIVARPFEKFFNLGTAGMPETDPSWFADKDGNIAEPEVWEKMDGFLATLYEYNGEQFIASKGSFNSTHAKWATGWYHANVKDYNWPKGYTPVFEGICSSLRIVVNYDFEGLVLLALVNNETGEEMDALNLVTWATKMGVRWAHKHNVTLNQAKRQSLDPNIENFEGYVLCWRRFGMPPFRLKVKYVDYLRLHRMVSGVSAKAIYNCLAGNEYKGDLDEWTNESTPWFSKFVTKWVRGLQARHDELKAKADAAMGVYRGVLNEQYKQTGVLPMKKDWAMLFQRPETKDVQAILFAMYNDKDVEQVIWKLVKPLTKNAGPLCSASLLR
jgi:RNA ligase